VSGPHHENGRAPQRAKRGQLPSGPLVSRIEVEKLFHTYSYVLDATHTSDAASGKLMLLYGNNGSGKTTILNLLYHLLHPEPYGSHRSFVGKIPFRLFRVHLVGGVVVTASRRSNYDAGGYELHARDPHRKADLLWTWRPEESRRSEDEEPGYVEFCSFLNQLGLSFHYLRDTRRVDGRQIARRTMFPRAPGGREDVFFLSGPEAPQELLLPERQLAASVDAAIEWFRKRALSATNVGYTSVNSIYRDIIKRIVTARASQQAASPSTADELIEALLGLKKKNSTFARFGLTPELDVAEITKSLQSASPRHLSMLNTVLGPYLEGHAARLDALEELQEVMSSFVSLLREFYSHKEASVHLEKGLHITSDTGLELDPVELSSGEKQLLLLFCNAISSRKDKTVLMIDEPEISLNVRWQRELIPALLTCMSGTAFQLILATHSVELIARYRDCVTALDNIDEVIGHA
jgi:energy-coupling factor transporter ATP-binding protein EcfA2